MDAPVDGLVSASRDPGYAMFEYAYHEGNYGQTSSPRLEPTNAQRKSEREAFGERDQSILIFRRNCWFSLQTNSIGSSSTVTR
jgi:hypothetical protein